METSSEAKMDELEKGAEGEKRFIQVRRESRLFGWRIDQDEDRAGRLYYMVCSPKPNL